MTRRVQVVLLGILLLLALAATTLAAWGTIGAFLRFQHQHALAKSGDVSTIRPWMTVPYIARTYQVPEMYLYQSLHIDTSSPSSLRHVSLHGFSIRYNRPENELIKEVQNAILDYRKTHPSRTGTQENSSFLDTIWRGQGGSASLPGRGMSPPLLFSPTGVGKRGIGEHPQTPAKGQPPLATPFHAKGSERDQENRGGGYS